ncbi:MAG: hypothetical protein DCF26_03920 [Burkholderiales bacterium]|nr:MAG: hypothetical protein DCF26_03920 [Burkholderiales bacterium]
MKLGTFALWLALTVPCAAMSAEMVRWTDDGGRVHYGLIADVPQRYVHRVESASAALPPGTTACEASWHRYAASAACFDQYRVVGGGLKPEAFERCTEVPQPDCN